MGGFGEFAGLFASSAAGGPFRGSRSLRGWACRLVAVTAIEIGVGDAHPASLRAEDHDSIFAGLRHRHFFLLQSSSASRVAAAALGFFILSQSGERPER